MKKLENELNETMDWIMDFVAGSANPYNAKKNLEFEVNDYVMDKYENLSIEDKNWLIDEAYNQYKKDDIEMLIDNMVAWVYDNKDEEQNQEYNIKELLNAIEEDGLFEEYSLYYEEQEEILNKVKERTKFLFQ